MPECLRTLTRHESPSRFHKLTSDTGTNKGLVTRLTHCPGMMLELGKKESMLKNQSVGESPQNMLALRADHATRDGRVQ